MSNQDQINLYNTLATVAQAAGVISVVMIALSVYAVLMSTRREHPLTTRRLYVGIFLSGLSLSALFYFSKIHLQTDQWFLFGGIGLALGLYWARTVQVFRKADGVYNRNTMMYVALWGITMILSQVFSNLSQKYVEAAAQSAILSFGIVIGMNISLLRKFFAYRNAPESGTPAK